MADETNPEEMVEEAPLSAEELFELHKAEIDAAFEEPTSGSGPPPTTHA